MSDMLDELSQILLHQADQLLVAAGRRAAEDFIGFKLPDEFDTFGFRESSAVDLSRFDISGVFERAYRSIKQPCHDNVMDTDVDRLQAFVFHVPRSGSHSAVCPNPLPFMTPEGVCQHVADTAYARWKLEAFELEDHSLRELALLADLSDEEFQTSIDMTDADLRLCAVQHSNPITISRKSALIWLAGQAGFEPSCTGPEALSRVSSIEGFAALIRYHRTRSKKSLDPQGCIVAPETLKEWERDPTVYEPALAAAIARQFDLNVPLFVGKAMEISFRHKETA